MAVQAGGFAGGCGCEGSGGVGEMAAVRGGWWRSGADGGRAGARGGGCRGSWVSALLVLWNLLILLILC